MPVTNLVFPLSFEGANYQRDYAMVYTLMALDPKLAEAKIDVDHVPGPV